MSKQPCEFPDITQWEKDHPGDIEFCCEFCGIYVAGKPRCNRCQGEAPKVKPVKTFAIRAQSDFCIYYDDTPPKNNSAFPDHGRGKKGQGKR